MPLLELKELKRLGYGFGLKQRGLLVSAVQAPAADFFSPEDAAALVEKFRSCLPDGESQVGDGVSLIDVACWAGSLQRRARIPLFALPIPLSSRPAGDGREAITVLLPYIDVESARMSLAFAIELLNGFHDAAAKGETASALDTLPAKINDLVGKLSLRAPSGVNSYRICKAAYDERVPFAVVFRDTLQLGEGIRLKRMISTITDRVSSIGVGIARNKMQTAHTLSQAGFPTVRHAAATSEDHAVTLAGQTGYPTVVKPADSDGGAGVSAGLMTEAAVRFAYRSARKVSKNVIVETFVPGNDYRVTIYNGKIVKTTVRRPGGVDGDGVSSVRELIALKKDDPQSQRRMLERGRFLLELDDEALELLAERGMTGDSVPLAGQFVPLRRRSNVSTGGTTKNIHGTLHPDNEAMLLRVVDLLGLDFGGIDYISPDISKSWTGVQSAILEINAQPQLDNDLNPTLYNEVLREYLGGTARVPWVLVVSGDAKTKESRSLGERVRLAMEQRASPAVVATSGGVWVGSSRIAGGPGSLASACESIVLGRFAAAAVIVADPSLIVAHGLPTEDLEFVALTNEPRRSADEFALCCKLVVPHIRRGLLVEADDPAIETLKDQLPAEKLFLLCPAAADDAIRAHLSGGGRAVWIESKEASETLHFVFGAGEKRVEIGTMDRAEISRRTILDLMIARTVQVHLPTKKPVGLQQEAD